MKKLLKARKQKKQEERSSRITNETVAEHRERILAGGRRFKYPMQYARHRLVFNTILISVAALIAITLLVWWQLYPQQNSSTFFYRITKVLPLPVASVDGESVRYSDYLAEYRSQMHYLETKEVANLDDASKKRQTDFIKDRAMENTIADTYAAKIAREKGVKLTKQQIDDATERYRQSRDGTISQETYDAIVLDQYNWTPQEARGVTERRLLRQEVSYAVDDNATVARDKVVAVLQTEKDFAKVAATVGGAGDSKVTTWATTLVPRSNRDAGLAAAASKLKKGETSQPFKSTTGDGYYVVRLLETDNNSQISYEVIKIPLTKFTEMLKDLKKNNKINKYIKLEAVEAQTSPTTLSQ